MATWADIVNAAKDRDLIRKSLDAMVVIDTVTNPLPSTFIKPETGELSLPATVKMLGWHSDEGLQWSHERENSEIAAHGSSEPVRIDLEKINNTLQVTALEENVLTIGLSLDLDLDPVMTTPYEYRVTEPARPRSRELRAYAISRDDTEYGDYFHVRAFARAKVESVEIGNWAGGDNAKSRAITLKALGDPVAGYAVDNFFGGPGLKGLAARMGLTPPAGG